MGQQLLCHQGLQLIAILSDDLVRVAVQQQQLQTRTGTRVQAMKTRMRAGQENRHESTGSEGRHEGRQKRTDIWGQALKAGMRTGTRAQGVKAGK
eukprot:1147088-Pelagomonas_calceolata.AAC.1